MNNRRLIIICITGLIGLAMILDTVTTLLGGRQ